MKKEQIIKSMLFLIIPLFAISCDVVMVLWNMKRLH